MQTYKYKNNGNVYFRIRIEKLRHRLHIGFCDSIINPCSSATNAKYFQTFFFSIIFQKCSGAPVSGCSSLEEEVGGKNERFSALTHEYS